MPERVLIMGAAGRDFHNFNVKYRGNSQYEVVGFTATQIPDIAGRVYPRGLAGPQYPEGIRIFPESELVTLIKRLRVDTCVFSYSDVAHIDVMHKASQVLAAGASFTLLGPDSSMLRSAKPVVSVCAVRTGVGKSATTRRVVEILKQMGLRPGVVRHPMPYGDLLAQSCQRFSNYDDLSLHKCTVEEREEYEPHIATGTTVYAGVDYETILRLAESESDVVVWDGGNNDMPFYRPDISIVLADPHRPGHEVSYHPGETNLRMADIILVNKVDTADSTNVDAVIRAARSVNPGAAIIRSAMPVSLPHPEKLAGLRVLAIEDGPTVTHGEMAYGAGVIAARRYGAELVDPRGAAQGSIKEAYAKYPHMGLILPALGYSERQLRELEQTVAQVDCDMVLVATPIDLGRLIKIRQPSVRVTYGISGIDRPDLDMAIRELWAARKLG